MVVYLGLIIVLGTAISGFLMGSERIEAFFHPSELLIVGGMFLGAFIISYPKEIRRMVLSSFKKFSHDKAYSKEDYIELLLFLFSFLKKVASSPANEVESQIDNPYEAPIFHTCPVLLKNQAALQFFCDYMRIIALGFGEVEELDTMMENSISNIKDHMLQPAFAIQKMGDALPGIGLVAAVMGMILALASAGEEVAVLGARVAAAMVGTFLGIFASYAIVTPLGIYLETFIDKESKIFDCLKYAIISYAKGHTPSVCIEFARQMSPIDSQPSFAELEEMMESNRNI